MPANTSTEVDSSTDAEQTTNISTASSGISTSTTAGATTPTTVLKVISDSPKYDINDFQLKRILQNNTNRKSIALLGTFPNLSASDEAILLFEKQAFRESDVQTDNDASLVDSNRNDDDNTTPSKPSYFSSKLKVHTEFINNIYGSFQCTPGAELTSVKTTVVYPATEKHIEKYAICQKFLISETPELYQQITLPFLQKSQFSLQWVYNILEHKQETERIVFEHNDADIGFVLLPDLKWDGRNVENLYLLAIPHKHNIKSLRDLTAEHLPLLHNMRQRISAAIAERYALQPNQLRMYFHYQPSFYHLHLHINPLRNDAPGIWCEKSHLLETVINNLELLSDYYQRATLPFVLYDGSKLLEEYEQQHLIRRSKAVRRKLSTEKADEQEQAEVVAKKLKINETQTTE